MTRCLDCGSERTTDQCPSCGLTSAAAEVMFRRRLVFRTGIFLLGSLAFPYVSQIYPPLDLDLMLIFFGIIFFGVLFLAVILDTNAVSALFAGDSALAAVLASSPRHHLPVIVIGEYRFGLLRSRHRERLALLLAALIQESSVLIVDQVTAGVYSQVREDLRTKGRPIPENDIWIAALALQHQQPVVSRDDHFDSVRSLVRLGW